MIRISGVSKTTFYVKKRDSAERAQMSSPVNKKVDKKFTEKLKKHVVKNSTMSIRKTAKLFNVDERTIRRTLKTLGKVVWHLLTERRKTLRLKKIFSGKLLSVDCVINRQNDRFTVQKGDRVPPVCHTKHSQSVMMLGIIASNGEKCLLIYIEEKEKVISDVYINFLKRYVVVWLKKTFPEGNYIFQQDNALCHGSRKNQQYL